MKKKESRRINCIAVAMVALLTLFAAQATAARDRDTLRILAIGNSFSDDAMEYLPALLENMGIDNVELARLYVAGCSLDRHVAFYVNGESPYEFYRSAAGENRWVKSPERVSLQYALALGEWDIITMQQASGLSGRAESYRPHLDRLVGIVRAAQPRAHLAWHMTWAYSTDSTHRQFADYGGDQAAMFEAICSAVRRIGGRDSAFSIIIPSGSVIQSLRGSEVNDPPKDLTRDGYHMDLGAGRYALACTWYESFVRPFAGGSARGNTLRIAKGRVQVDDRVAACCQKAACKAVRRAARRNFEPKRIKSPRVRPAAEDEVTVIK